MNCDGIFVEHFYQMDMLLLLSFFILLSRWFFLTKICYQRATVIFWFKPSMLIYEHSFIVLYKMTIILESFFLLASRLTNIRIIITIIYINSMERRTPITCVCTLKIMARQINMLQPATREFEHFLLWFPYVNAHFLLIHMNRELFLIQQILDDFWLNWLHKINELYTE